MNLRKLLGFKPKLDNEIKEGKTVMGGGILKPPISPRPKGPPPPMRRQP